MREAEAFARYRGLIDDWPAFVEAIAEPLPTTLWTNTLRTSPEALAAELGPRVRPLAWLPGAFRAAPDFSPGRHWAYLAGLFQIQEEVSMAPIQLLGLAPGERVLDLCAAPGNKTAQLAVRLQNRGRVVANDRSIPRMRACRQAFERLGLINVATTLYDARRFPPPARRFDRVLVDAPCTGEGTCRKLAPRRWRSDPEDSTRMANIQVQILRHGVAQCRPGGRVIYSTCTFAPEENECVVDALLRGGAPVRLLSVALPGLRTEPGLTRWAGRALDPSLDRALRLWPHHNDSGGFFIAVLERLEDPASAPVVEARAGAPAVEEREPWLGQLERRFAMAPASFEDCTLLRAGTKALYLCNRDAGPLTGLTPDALGMRFIHTRDHQAKLTTAAAMAFGHCAQRNAVELEATQMRAYLERRELERFEPDIALEPGYVLPRYRGHTLGVAVYRPRERRLESMFPKSWARALDEP